MLIPLLVSEISPARKARLLFGSSQDPTPGTICAYSSCTYAMASRLGFCAMAMVLLSFSTALPPKVQSTQCVQLLPSPTAWPRANPTGCPFAFSARASLSKSAGDLGNSSKPASFVQLVRYVRHSTVPPTGTAIQCLIRLLYP